MHRREVPSTRCRRLRDNRHAPTHRPAVGPPLLLAEVDADPTADARTEAHSSRSPLRSGRWPADAPHLKRALNASSETFAPTLSRGEPALLSLSGATARRASFDWRASGRTSPPRSSPALSRQGPQLLVLPEASSEIGVPPVLVCCSFVPPRNTRPAELARHAAGEVPGPPQARACPHHPARRRFPRERPSTFRSPCPRAAWRAVRGTREQVLRPAPDLRLRTPRTSSSARTTPRSRGTCRHDDFHRPARRRSPATRSVSPNRDAQRRCRIPARLSDPTKPSAQGSRARPKSRESVKKRGEGTASCGDRPGAALDR